MIERLSPSTSELYNLQSVKSDQKESIEIKVEDAEQRELSKEQLELIIPGLNKIIQPVYTSIRFELHEESKEHYIKVINEHTKKVIREIPSKEMLEVHAAMTQFLGLMFDKKA